MALLVVQSKIQPSAAIASTLCSVVVERAQVETGAGRHTRMQKTCFMTCAGAHTGRSANMPQFY
ncbi:hypothetical protein [Azospirillum canadense]|uniref:hypothetical protein n=1 Tax=Azospirillum canadense TaxID=403962 RepID=UPI002225E379|nr:hypothetical protein [Azospirillum canadense]MCW2241863.1 hypothetical protein [Azospirillum canadense]